MVKAEELFRRRRSCAADENRLPVMPAHQIVENTAQLHATPRAQMLKRLRTTRTGAVASRTSVSNACSEACLRVAEIGEKYRLSEVSPNVSVSICSRRFALLMALKCVVSRLLELMFGQRHLHPLKMHMDVLEPLLRDPEVKP